MRAMTHAHRISLGQSTAGKTPARRYLHGVGLLTHRHSQTVAHRLTSSTKKAYIVPVRLRAEVAACFRHRDKSRQIGRDRGILRFKVRLPAES